MSEKMLSVTLPEYDARIEWLEREVARLAAKLDATVSMGDERDTPTPKPSEGAGESVG